MLNPVEQTLTLVQSLRLLLPELILLLTSLLILALDGIFFRQRDKRWLPYVTLGGLAGALIATITLWGCDSRIFYVLSCDPFALVVKVVALVAIAIVVLVSDPYIRDHSPYQGEFYALLIFSTLAICLLSAAVNLIMIFLAFDFLSITSYILTGYLREDRRSAEGAIKYLLYGAALSAVMLYGLSWLYGLTGSTDLAGIAAALRGIGVGGQLTVFPVLILIMAGLAFKVGVAPFHQWAPDAYEGAPTPVTAFLSVGPKIAGFSLIVRVMLVALPMNLGGPSLNWQSVMLSLSVLTMFIGNLVALWQQNIKRLLAYSSIAQAGYILIGVVTASPRGVIGVALYLAAYALTNLGVFAAVIAFSNQTGSDNIEDYAGLNKRAPLLALVLLICLLSLGGIPPTAGFMGKLYLFSAAIESGLTGLAVVGVINSVISLAYYWKIIRAIYFLPARTEDRVVTSPTLGVALGMAVAGVFGIGILPSLFLPLLQRAALFFFQG